MDCDADGVGCTISTKFDDRAMPSPRPTGPTNSSLDTTVDTSTGKKDASYVWAVSNALTKL